MGQDDSLQPESQKYLALVSSRDDAMLNRCGMQRHGSPRTRWRGAFLLLVVCTLASEGIGIVGIPAGEGVESRDVPGGGRTPQERLTAGDGGGYNGTAVGNTGSAAKDNDASEETEDANKDFVPPEPSEAVQMNGVQDLEEEELKKAVNELPPKLLEELPPELWGFRDLKQYKRAEKNTRKGDKAIEVAAKIATFGAFHSRGGAEALVALLLLSLISGVIAAPVAIGGAIRRSIGRRQKRKLKDQLNKKKKRMELRTKELPMLTRQHSGQPQRAE